jgi:predicted small lipoprotein YifL
MTRRNVLELAAAMLAGALLAACGRKGRLLQPEEVDPDDNSEYMMWPDEDASGDQVYPEDANPNPGDAGETELWNMEGEPEDTP